MAIEIDFLAVGDESKSGDAIAFRCGNLLGERHEWFCGVIDGGTLDAGERLVDFIIKQYRTDWLDLAVNSHPDGDHSCGLRLVLESLGVGELWLHRPWTRSAHLRAAMERQPGAIVLNESARATLNNARELERIAIRRGIPIIEPFAGDPLVGNFNDHRGRILVLGPSEEYYNSLLELEETEETASVTNYALSALSRLVEGGVGLLAKLFESVDCETLQDPADNATSASNNSSVVLAIENDGQRVLLTADAGVPALERAEHFASAVGIDLRTCGLQQVPHHGSRRNMGPSMLDVLVGQRGQRSNMAVYVSAAKNGRPKHPNVRVTNAYMRRGAGVYSTEGNNIVWGAGPRPLRPGYSPIRPLDFHTGEVEGDDE